MAPTQVKMCKEWPKWERHSLQEHSEMCFSLYQRRVWSRLHLNAPFAVHINRQTSDQQFLKREVIPFKHGQKSLQFKVNVEAYKLKGDAASPVSQQPAELSLMPPWAWRGPRVEKSQSRMLSGTRLMVLLRKELKWRRRVVLVVVGWGWTRGPCS